MVKSLIRSQAVKHQQMEKDLSRQEQRWKRMQHQIQQKQLHVHEIIEDHRSELVESQDGYT